MTTMQSTSERRPDKSSQKTEIHQKIRAESVPRSDDGYSIEPAIYFAPEKNTMNQPLATSLGRGVCHHGFCREQVILRRKFHGWQKSAIVFSILIVSPPSLMCCHRFSREATRSCRSSELTIRPAQTQFLFEVLPPK